MKISLLFSFLSHVHCISREGNRGAQTCAKGLLGRPNTRKLIHVPRFPNSLSICILFNFTCSIVSHCRSLILHRDKVPKFRLPTHLLCWNTGHRGAHRRLCQLLWKHYCAYRPNCAFLTMCTELRTSPPKRLSQSCDAPHALDTERQE